MLTPFRLQWLLPHFLYCAFRDLFKRERWKFRRHDLGRHGKEYVIQDGTGVMKPKFFPYMLRWILQTPFGGIRLQKICASDKERHLHDHPFDFITIRLRGKGYLEVTPLLGNGITRENWHQMGMPTQEKYHWPFSALFRRATDLHQLELPRWEGTEKPQWTLFIHGPNIREWGFQTEQGWKQWGVYEKEYLNSP